MVKKLLQMMLLAALLVPLGARAQVACDGSNLITRSNADTSSGNSYQFPANGYYNYSYSEVIVPADQMNGIGTIKALQFYVATAASSGNYYANTEIYLANVATEDLSEGFVQDLISFKKVFTGNLDPTSTGWKTIVFDTTFFYDGVSNLLVAMRRNSGTYVYNRAYFATANAGVPLTRYAYRDSDGAYTIGSITDGYTSSDVPWYRFVGCDDAAVINCNRVNTLSVSNITTDGATLTWTDSLNSGATYTIRDLATGEYVATGISGNSYVISNFNSNTLYTLSLTADCGAGDTSIARTISFRTGCDVTVLPYSTGFEDGIAGQNYFCWGAPRTGTSGSGTFPSVYQYSYNAHNGDFYYEFESSNLDTEVAALPVIQSIDGTKLSFWAYSDNPDNIVFEAGVIEDDSVFVPVDRLNITSDNYHQYNVYFPTYSGSATRMGLRFTGSGFVMIDDLSIVEYDGCAEVRSLTVDTVTSDTIAISWSPSGGSETSYAVRLNGGEWIDVYDTFYVFEELSPSTLYTIDVVALCDDTSLARTLSVRTECADFINAPYSVTDMVATQDPVSRLPFCWTAPETTLNYSTVYPYVYEDYYYGFYLYFRPIEDEPNMVVLPRVDNLAPNAINVEVNGYVYSYYPAKLYFGYVTNPDSASTFVAIDSITGTSRANYEFNTSAVPDNVDSIWLAFRATTTASYSYAYLYSVAISRYSTCTRPDALTVDSVTHNMVALHWNGTGADEYQVALTTGTNPDVLSEDDGLYMADGDTSIVINNLTPGTNYNIWVRSICGSDDTSVWRQGTSFRTVCGPTPCMLTVDMVDSYGDGWNGNAVNVYVGSDLATSFTLLTGSTGSGSYPVCDGDSVTLTWTSGSYPNETSFTIFRAGSEIVSGGGSNYSNGQFITSFVGCPSCQTVSSVVVDSVSANSITIHWTPNNEDDDTWVVSLDGVTVASNVTTTTYTFTGLTANHMYAVGVATVCSESLMSTFNTVSTVTTCAGVACDVDVILDGTYNSYGTDYHPWYEASGYIDVYQNGILKGRTNQVSYYDLAGPKENFISICAGDSVQFRFYSNNSWNQDYLPYCEYIILNGNGDTIATADSLTGVVSGDLLAVGMTSCPSCITPVDIAETDATTTSITLGWTNVTPAAAWSLRVTDEAGTTTNLVATTNPYTLTGLQPASYYWVSMAAICSPGDTSNYSLPVRVSTECNEITLPWDYDYTTDFNSDYNDEMPICWYSPESYYSYGTYPYAYNGGTSGYVYMYASSEGNNMVATPRIPESANNLYVSFSGYQSNNPLAQAGVMTDPSDPSTFIPIVNVTASSAATEHEFFTAGVPGLTANDTVYVAFRASLVPGGNTYGYFYLYNVHVQRAPDTHRPDSTWVTALTINSATINWSSTNATSYEVTIGGNTYTTTGTSFNATGLTPGTNYTYTIVAIGTDTAIALHGAFATECPTAITLPYIDDFESYAQYSVPNCWTVKNTAADSYGNATPYIYTTTYTSSSIHSGFGALYFYSGANKHPMAISPALTGEPLNNLWVSFWVYGGSSYGFEAGFMTDPNDTSTFIPVLNVPGTTYSQVNYTFRTDSIADTSSVYHFAIRFNNTASYNGGIYVDDLIIRNMPDCAEDFASVRISDIKADSAKVNFAAGLGLNVGATYAVTVLDANNNVAASASGSTSPLQLSGLYPSTTYRAYVELTCGGAVTAVSDTVTFVTRCADNSVLAVEDATSAASEYIPMNNYYRHSASQQIYRASELGSATTITSVAYNYLIETPLTGYRAKIYLDHTADSAARGHWVDESTMQLVYDGDFNCVQGWNEFFFSTPFEYNGTDNLLVMVVADSTGYAASGYRFASHNAGDSASVRFASDSYEYEYGSSNITYSCYSTSYRNDIRFYTCNESECVEPIIVGTTPAETAITVNFIGEAGSYEVAIAENWDEATVNAIAITDTFYTFNGLTAATAYTVGVRAMCGATLNSDWVTITVTTDEHPCFTPSALTVSDITFNSATLGWTIGEAESEWQLHVTGPNYDQTFTVNTNPYTITGLASATEYSFTVTALCSETQRSDASEAQTFTTLTCQPVSGVTVSNETTTTAQVQWTAPDGVSSFDIEYGASGFAQGTGTHATATTNSITLSGLTPGTMYDVYVRSACGDNVYSSWSNVVSFETEDEGEGIEDVNNANIALYPNPATTTVTISGIEGQATVTIVDMNGRENGKWNVENGKITIDLTGYAQGAYFVRITGEQVSAIRKLIVK